MAKTKTEKYIEKFRNVPYESLLRERTIAEQTAKSCQDYIASAHNTFLGPLAAHANLKDCYARIEAIDLILTDIKENKS